MDAKDANSYYSIDAILAEQIKIPTVFNVTVDGLGLLIGSQESLIKKEGRLEMPLWIAEHLARSDYIDLSLPKIYSSTVRNALQANPNSVNIRKLHPHFYRAAIALLDLASDKEGTLSPLLIESFKLRTREIMDHATAVVSIVEQNDFLSGLDDTEKYLYKIGQESAKAMRTWQEKSFRGSSHSSRKADELRRFAQLNPADMAVE